MMEFLRLPQEEQRDIVLTIAAETGFAPQILHKDIWVCWALHELFRIRSSVRMAFKGGTSLSKVFRAIDRFSEDLDISLDYRDLTDAPDIDVFSPEITTSARKRYCKQLALNAREHIYGTLFPALEQAFLAITDHKGKAEISDDGERLWLHYPVLNQTDSAYIDDWILIEFGGRNITEPNESHVITPTIAAFLPSLDFPRPDVQVLSPERTFWEKATLIHVECHRERSGSPNRLSRHWYDLVMLARGTIGKQAIENRELLGEVVRHKSTFFDARYANYQDCLSGKLLLIPSEPLLSRLKNDYSSMENAGMFATAVPRFEALIEELREIERAIND